MKMRIVPETATEEMRSSCLTATVAVLWPRVLAAAPSAGRVSREAVERVARALFKEQRREAVKAGAIFFSETFNWRVCVPEARAAIAALGLEMEGDDDPAG